MILQTERAPMVRCAQSNRPAITLDFIGTARHG